MASPSESILGINLKAGTAFLGVVERPGSPVTQAFIKLEPPANVDPWDRLQQFGERVVAEARACGAVCVAFAEPRLGTWAYSDAVERVSLQTAGALALRKAGIEVLLVHPKTAASKLGFAGKIKAMDEGVAETLSLDAAAVSHWDSRRPAFEVAASVARERWK
jgi:hypothetical protein